MTRRYQLSMMQQKKYFVDRLWIKPVDNLWITRQNRGIT
jgi:hypothetical protein